MTLRTSVPKDSAFEPLWENERPRVWRLAVRLSGSVDAADDLTQEIGIRALAAYPKFRRQAAFSTWLYRIAVNTILRWREQQRVVTMSSELLLQEYVSPLPTPEGSALHAESTARIHKALDTLPDDIRTPLLLHVWEGLKYREIADVMEIPMGTVMSRLHTARQRLRTELKELHDEAF